MMEMSIKKKETMPKPGGVEKAGLVVTALFSALCYFFGSPTLALGAAAGGLLVLANFYGIRVVVGIFLGGERSKKFVTFVIMLKMTTLVALVLGLFMFAKINIHGFIIGVFGVVLIIIVDSLLRGNEDGSF